MRQRILGVVLLGAFGGCGGAPPPPVDEPAMPAESASVEPIEEEEAPEPEVPSVPESGPATLKVVTTVGSDPVKAKVRIFDADGNVLAEGASGQPLSVRSGDLEIEATLSDSKALLGHETVHRSVSLEAGADATEKVSFERSRVRIEVRIGGKLDKTAVVTLSKDGEKVAKLTSGDKDYASIAPGRYQVRVHSKRAEIESSDITLNEGATQTVPINVH